MKVKQVLVLYKFYAIENTTKETSKYSTAMAPRPHCNTVALCIVLHHGNTTSTWQIGF